jgi:hypothetical protein
MEHDEIIEELLNKISAHIIGYIYISVLKNPNFSQDIIKIG